MNDAISIGIDLGTSNSALAVAADDSSAARAVSVTQLSGPGELLEQELLPSALYLPHEAEFESSQLALPWSAHAPGDPLVGRFARDHGALMPERLISSAKSWLCHANIDRSAAILPWQSEVALKKRSPLEASRLILSHLREGLLLQHPAFADANCFTEVEKVLTVPASFDEAARRLTYQAAVEAGWGEMVLLEEPLAAFYAWIDANASSWREQVEEGDIVLICDIGGGTTDFSLIAVGDTGGMLELRRISVGEHILLGGDNMDLALAYQTSSGLADRGQALDDWQFRTLTQLVRGAKEKLLMPDGSDEIPLSIPGRGSSLFASTIQASLKRQEVESILLDGFFPFTASDEFPRRTQSGLREAGLPYAADAALSKHLAAFLRDSLRNVESDSTLSAIVPGSRRGEAGIVPNKILFNGGVCTAPLVRERILSILRGWVGDAGVEPLSGAELDLAVARGAAAYGRIRRTGKGHRIRAGTARSFYVGLESSMLAVPGFTPPIKGLCLVPQGTEEGTSSIVAEREFSLYTGESVRFRFFSSSMRAGDVIGAIVEQAADQLDELPQLEASIAATGDGASEVLPVRLRSVVTELGTLELWMEHTQSERRWKLELDLRPQG